MVGAVPSRLRQAAAEVLSRPALYWALAAVFWLRVIVLSAIDASDNLYVADPFNYTVRKITPAGFVMTTCIAFAVIAKIGIPAFDACIARISRVAPTPSNSGI